MLGSSAGQEGRGRSFDSRRPPPLRQAPLSTSHLRPSPAWATNSPRGRPQRSHRPLARRKRTEAESSRQSNGYRRGARGECACGALWQLALAPLPPRFAKTNCASASSEAATPAATAAIFAGCRFPRCDETRGPHHVTGQPGRLRGSILALGLQVGCPQLGVPVQRKGIAEPAAELVHAPMADLGL